jgi:pyrimidine deaminase RibD-like protein
LWSRKRKFAVLYNLGKDRRLRVIHVDLLEQFLLRFGLQIPDNGLGRPTTITQLWLRAGEACGECDMNEVLDGLYNLDSRHAELYKFVPVTAGFQQVSFERARSAPNWADFFTTGDFRIKVLPAGRKRMQELSELNLAKQNSPTVVDDRKLLDRKFAELAIEEARQSISEDGRPHPKVGAVVVKDGRVLSKAHRGEKEKSHAEYIALEDKLSDDLVAGSTVYTTLEPCTTRTHPKIPCAQRLIDRRVGCVVIGMFDPNPAIWGKGWRRLRDAGIETRVFDDDLIRICEEMNREFIRVHKENSTDAATGSAKAQNGTVARVALSQTNDDLSPKEIELLWNAAKDTCRDILHTRTFEGESIRINGRQFLENVDARTGADWVAAFRRLQDRGFIEPLRDGGDFFQVTGDGYGAADELDGFVRWDAKSIVLRARYMNSPDDEVTLSCKGIIAVPPRYFEDQVGADRAVQRSLKEPRTLLVEGIDSKPALAWNPTEVEFLDSGSGQSQSFLVTGMEFTRPGSLKLPIVA